MQHATKQRELVHLLPRVSTAHKSKKKGKHKLCLLHSSIEDISPGYFGTFLNASFNISRHLQACDAKQIESVVWARITGLRRTGPRRLSVKTSQKCLKSFNPWWPAELKGSLSLLTLRIRVRFPQLPSAYLLDCNGNLF